MSADPLRIFDALEPPAGWGDPTDLDADPVAATILERVFTDTSNVVSLDAARRRRRGIAGAIVVAALVTGGAVAAVWNRSPQQTNRVACWSDAELPPDKLVGVAWDGLIHPVDLCSEKWADGEFEAPTPPPDRLQVCVTDSELAAVIPGDSDTCDRLGFAEYAPPAAEDVALAVNRAQRELGRALATSCLQPAVAEGEIQRILASNGLSGWTITLDGTFSADEPCATVALVPETTTAFVRPARRD